MTSKTNEEGIEIDKCILCNEVKNIINESNYIQLLNKISQLEEINEINQDNVISLQKVISKNSINCKNDINELVINEKLKLIEQLTKKRDELYLNASQQSVKVETNRITLDSSLEKKHQLENQLTSKTIIKEMLKSEVECVTKRLNDTRWKQAIELFVMMRIIPDKGYENKELLPSTTKSNQKSKITLTGISTILGFPLPNNGKYDGAPIMIITTALTHICHLVDCLSTVLNIQLPHRINPFTDNYCSTITTQVTLSEDERRTTQILAQAIHRNKGSKISSTIKHESLQTLSEQLNQIKLNNQNIKSFPWKVIPSFRPGLDLLKANVIILCLKAGVAPEALYPPQAMLLNLYQLYRYCNHQSSISDYINDSIEYTLPSSNDNKIYNSIKLKYSINSDKNSEVNMPYVDLTKEKDWAIVEIDDSSKY